VQAQLEDASQPCQEEASPLESGTRLASIVLQQWTPVHGSLGQRKSSSPINVPNVEYHTPPAAAISATPGQKLKQFAKRIKKQTPPPSISLCTVFRSYL
jgi:hypothetical protein